MNAIEYCSSLLRARDYEHFIATLFLPRTVRRSVVAIRAFNVETALVQNQVSNRTTGQGRIYFWRDVIKNIDYDKASDVHPVVSALTSYVAVSKLTKRWLLNIIDARSHQIDNPSGFITTESLEQYCENTQSSLLYIILEACGIQDLHLDHAASHLGKAGGLVLCLRAAAPLALIQHQVDFPMDILNQHNLSQQDIIRGKDTQQIRDATYDLASIAHFHLKHFKIILAKRTKEKSLTKRIFLPNVSYEKFLKLIQKCNFNLFDPRLQKRNGLLPIHFLLALLRR